MIRFFNMDLWLSVIDKKVSHPYEIQNTFGNFLSIQNEDSLYRTRICTKVDRVWLDHVEEVDSWLRKPDDCYHRQNRHNFLCKIGESENAVTWQMHERTVTSDAPESWQRVVSLHTRILWLTRVTLTYEIQSEIHVCVFTLGDYKAIGKNWRDWETIGNQLKAP